MREKKTTTTNVDANALKKTHTHLLKVYVLNGNINLYFFSNEYEATAGFFYSLNFGCKTNLLFLLFLFLLLPKV